MNRYTDRLQHQKWHSDRDHIFGRIKAVHVADKGVNGSSLCVKDFPTDLMKRLALSAALKTKYVLSYFVVFSYRVMP